MAVVVREPSRVMWQLLILSTSEYSCASKLEFILSEHLSTTSRPILALFSDGYLVLSRLHAFRDKLLIAPALCAPLEPTGIEISDESGERCAESLVFAVAVD